MNKKKKALAKFVRAIPADDLKRVSGGVNADEQDRQQILAAFVPPVVAPVKPR